VLNVNNDVHGPSVIPKNGSIPENAKTFTSIYVLCEKPYILQGIIEYDLYPLSLVISQVLVGYTCELTNSSGYKSYSMTNYEISSIYMMK